MHFSFIHSNLCNLFIINYNSTYTLIEKGRDNMQHILKNEFLTATFNSKGAELCSLVDANGIEYIWSADPAYWGRHTPVLFPLVGKVTDGNYTHNGTTYTLGQHGFARDMEFVVTKESETTLTFTLTSNAHTHTLYPFSFELSITYTLSGKDLSIGYQVVNTDETTIGFKLGAHPGFMCPLFENEKMEDYYLEFDTSEKATMMQLTPEGLFTHTTSLFEGQRIDLSVELFDQDALVFKNLVSSSITLASKHHDKKLTVTFKDFPFLGIWSTPHKRSPFVCIEPWFGHADFVDESTELLNKKDLVILDAKQAFVCEHIISIH